MVVTPVIHVILTVITSPDLELKLNKWSVCEETRVLVLAKAVLCVFVFGCLCVGLVRNVTEYRQVKW